MAAAEALTITRGIDDAIRVVDERVGVVDDKVGFVIKGELFSVDQSLTRLSIFCLVRCLGGRFGHSTNVC